MNDIGNNTGDWGSYFELTADIDLGGYTGTQFNIIGNSTTKFTGTFDGDGHTISNFTYTCPDTDAQYIGIFGWAENPAEIKNLGLIDPNIDTGTSDPNGGNDIGSLVGCMQGVPNSGGNIIGCWVQGGSVTGEDYVGSLVGRMEKGGNIIGCWVQGGSVTGEDYVGGLVGRVHTSSPLVDYAPTTISDCYTTCTVRGNYKAGGLVGGIRFPRQIYISNCYATGSVEGDEYAGGLVGSTQLTGADISIISNCYAVGDVNGENMVGGLVGESTSDPENLISNCYSTGLVTGSGDYVGGFVGANGGTIENSFWDVNTSGLDNMCGLCYGACYGCDDSMGKTTAQMKMRSTFVDAGWDFVGELANGADFIWDIYEGKTYPRLGLVGDFAEPYGVGLEDLAFFVEHWLNDNYGDADLNQSGSVDFADYAVFADIYPIRSVYENFETGDFSKYDWQHSGAASWTVGSDFVYEGSYSAKSGAIGDMNESVLEITPVLKLASVSFYSKVSSEENWDYLRFYVDGELKGEWSGEQDWAFHEYSIEAGGHTFKWAYEKDKNLTGGSDCAWIDKIIMLP